jgi:hypothetical protein
MTTCRSIGCRERVEAPLADAVDLEDPLGEDRAGQEGGEVESEDRGDRYDDGAQGVLERLQLQ